VSEDKEQSKNGIKEKLGNAKLNPFIILLVILVAWSVLSFLLPVNSPDKDKKEPISITETFQLIREEKVSKVTIDGNNLDIQLKDGQNYTSTKEPQISFIETLSLQNIDPSLVSSGIFEKQSISWIEILSNLAIPLTTLIFLWWIFRQAGRSSGGLFSIGKSRAKLYSKDSKDKIGFKDVAGAEEIKNELFEIVDFLKRPEKYRKLGARIPRGILLIGPSGVGKTLLARAIAGEANVPFYSVAGSEFIEMIVGVGSARVRDLFKVAKETSPSLIFIDEIDAIGRQRGRAAAVSNDEREQTLNQILVEMDGFDVRTNVIIIAATNRPDMLDSALVRPGRFDRHIQIDLPDVVEREGIMKIHMRGKPFAKNVDIKRLARQTVGFSGADIENMLNEAAILAARKGAAEIDPLDLSEASSKVKLGPGRKRLQSEKERQIIAYHEAGHALIADKNPDADPVSRISIVSRTMSLGHTEIVPKDQVYNQTKGALLAKIESLLGGRVSEELVFSEQTVGASNDIERATYIARIMVTEFGMSSLGPINYVSDNAGLWDARAQEKSIGYSDKVANEIDSEVRKIIKTEYENAKKILKDNRKVLDKLAKELLSKETLEQEDFDKIMSETERKPNNAVRSHSNLEVDIA